MSGWSVCKDIPPLRSSATSESVREPRPKEGAPVLVFTITGREISRRQEEFRLSCYFSSPPLLPLLKDETALTDGKEKVRQGCESLSVGCSVSVHVLLGDRTARVLYIRQTNVTFPLRLSLFCFECGKQNI